MLEMIFSAIVGACTVALWLYYHRPELAALVFVAWVLLRLLPIRDSR